MEELKKCPFCGGDAILKVHYGFDEKVISAFVYCKECGVATRRCALETTAIGKWNRRVERMIKVKGEANYGFAGTNMTFEEEFGDDVTDEEIEEAMRDMVMEQVDWSWEKE